MKLPGPALWDVFTDGTEIVTVHGDVEYTSIMDAGYLTLPTGKIALSDPFLDPFNEPFSVSVPAGAYPVYLAIIRGNVALVMVSFTDNLKPVRWVAADPPSLGVDSATGCLMDGKVRRFLRRKAENDKYEVFAKRFQHAMNQGEGLWGNYCLDIASGVNVVLFRTWGGDGNFPSYFGYAADGTVACLVTDMYLHDVASTLQYPGQPPPG